MANDVFANGREISCKSGSGKSICAFPDVCMTPPECPATPMGVPCPYPNTGKAGDTTSGSKKVKISDKEVMLKNKSYFKKSMGDEAGCAAKKGVVTSVNRGKVYFIAWSLDVLVEGENVVRHLDMTTHNHASPTTNTPPMGHIDSSTFASMTECQDDKDKIDEKCKDKDPCPGVLKYKVGEQRKQVDKKPNERETEFGQHAAAIAELADEARTTRAAEATTAEADASECVTASRCYLRPYKREDDKDQCCPGQTPHHIPPWSCYSHLPYGKRPSKDKALCVCMEGANQYVGSHGKNHAAIEWLAKEKGIAVGQTCNLGDYNALCAATVEAQCGCTKECIAAQLNNQFKDSENTDIKHKTTNSTADIDEDLDEIRKSAELPVSPTSSG